MTFFNSFAVVAGIISIAGALMIGITLVESGVGLAAIGGFALILLTLTAFVYALTNIDF